MGFKTLSIFPDLMINSNFYKSLIVLFTCAVTRAVHLEVVPNLTIPSFICALKRFISRRCIPNLIISDNGTFFKNEEVRFSEELTRMNISWKFIAAASPWWGGSWERLVQSVKRSLQKIFFRSTVDYEELVTIVTEIKGIINCRPLTYIYNDNTEEVVTPSHLIYGCRLLLKLSNDKPDNFSLENLTRRTKYLHTLLQHYWNRWKLQYLNELREYHRCGKEEDTHINVSDIVLVEDPTLKQK